MRRRIEARVAAVEGLSSDVRLFDIAPIEGALQFEPGGHVDVEIGNTGDVRSYSHVRPRERGGLSIAVKRMRQSRGGSAYMWSLSEGDRIWIRPAPNNFPVYFGASNYLLLAGGIGITPMIGIAEALRGSGKSVRLQYFVRDASDAPFIDMLETELESGLSVHDDSRSGRFDVRALIPWLTPDTVCYVCGPMPMMEAIRSAWDELGLPTVNLRFETFGSASGENATQFNVTVVETGLTITVPANMTMLDALISADQPIMFDCRKGECGLCKVDIEHLEGELDHRDVFFNKSQHREGHAMCACVSRVRNGSVRVRANVVSHGRST